MSFGARMSYWVVFLTPALQEKAPFRARKRLRMVGACDGVPLNMALQLKASRHYLLFSRALCRSLGAELGGTLEIQFTLVDHTRVEVPEELRLELKRRPDARARWATLSPGAQRGLSYRVDSAKSDDTRLRRAAEIAASLEDGIVPGRGATTRRN